MFLAEGPGFEKMCEAHDFQPEGEALTVASCGSGFQFGR